MNKYVLALFFSLVIPVGALAQHGTAETGYWPMGYVGDTWTGTVTSGNDETGELTLVYKHGDKEQTFVCVLRKGYTVNLKDGGPHQLKVSEIRIGSRVRVYYIPKTREIDGKKKKVYEVFQLEWLPDKEP